MAGFLVFDELGGSEPIDEAGDPLALPEPVAINTETCHPAYVEAESR